MDPDGPLKIETGVGRRQDLGAGTFIALHVFNHSTLGSAVF